MFYILYGESSGAQLVVSWIFMQQLVLLSTCYVGISVTVIILDSWRSMSITHETDSKFLNKRRYYNKNNGCHVNSWNGDSQPSRTSSWCVTNRKRKKKWLKMLKPRDKKVGQLYAVFGDRRGRYWWWSWHNISAWRVTSCLISLTVMAMRAF